MGEHIVSIFDEELLAIQAKISEMGGLVEECLSLALRAVREQDEKAAHMAIELDDRVNALDTEIEEMATNMIALRQPMAVDLRTLLSALKINSTLERIGDLSKNIARRAVIISPVRKVRMLHSLVAMGEKTQQHLTDVLDAYAERDDELAVAVWEKDVEIDEMYNGIFHELVAYMAADSRYIGVSAHMLFIAKNLERIGDHATYISESIHYIINGTHLGDERPKADPKGLGLFLDE